MSHKQRTGKNNASGKGKSKLVRIIKHGLFGLLVALIVFSLVTINTKPAAAG
jgi:hypothetical protein